MDPKLIAGGVIVGLIVGSVGGAMTVWRDVAVLKEKSSPDLSLFALKTDIPEMPDLSEYALKTDIPEIPDLSVYLRKTDIAAHEKDASANISEYEFESDFEIWNTIDEGNTRGCNYAKRTGELFRHGSHSLEIFTDVSGQIESKNSCEIYIDLITTSNNGIDTAIDLEGIEISTWAYGPKGTRGDRSKPNGYMLFAMDKNGVKDYGEWIDPIREDEWVQLKMRVGTHTEHGWMEEGFDASSIIGVGLKFGVDPISNAEYEGSIYMDSIKW